MALTNARKAVGLDAALTNVAKVFWYKGTAGNEVKATEINTDGSTAATLKSATSANPSVKATDGALESAAASDAITVTAFTFAIADGTEYTTVNRLTEGVVLLAGGKVSVVDGGLKEQLQHS